MAIWDLWEMPVGYSVFGRVDLTTWLFAFQKKKWCRGGSRVQVCIVCKHFLSASSFSVSHHDSHHITIRTDCKENWYQNDRLCQLSNKYIIILHVIQSSKLQLEIQEKQFMAISMLRSKISPKMSKQKWYLSFPKKISLIFILKSYDSGSAVKCHWTRGKPILTYLIGPHSALRLDIIVITDYFRSTKPYLLYQ